MRMYDFGDSDKKLELKLQPKLKLLLQEQLPARARFYPAYMLILYPCSIVERKLQ